MTIIVTGGAGFIGGNFIHYHLKEHPEDRVVCIDKLTYAGNLSTLASVMDNSNLSKWLRFDKYVDYINKQKYRFFCNHSHEYNNLINKLYCLFDREQSYYNQIKLLADDFKGNYFV